MKKTVKTIIKGLVLIAIGVASLRSAQAYSPLAGTYVAGDAIVGFTTGNGNELIANLGLISSLTNGEQWNLNTLLGTGSGNAGFPGLTNLTWGVIGITGGKYYSTDLNNPTATGNAAAANYLKSMFQSNINYPITSLGYSIDPASDTLSWYNNVVTANSSAAEAPYSLLLGSPDTTTPTSGSFTFAQDSATWYISGSTGGATTNFFAFNSSGILMFSNTVTSSGPPAPKIVAVKRTGTTSTIYFTTANSFTYALYYTNAAGLMAPVTNWPALPTTLTGNGLTNNLSDTTADTTRFYKVGAH